MANFVWAKDRYINLDHVASIEPVRPEDGKSKCFSPTGEMMGVIDTPAFAGEVNPPIPHTGTSYLLQFYEEGEQAADILAWELGRFGRWPILCEELCDGAVYCIVDRGAYIFQEDRAFDTFERARAYADERLKLQKERDARRRATERAAGANLAGDRPLS